MLTAGKHCGRYLFHLCCRKNEDNMGRRFLKGLQQRVECGGRKHMHLVDDIDLILPAGRGVFDPLPEVPDVVNAVV